MKRKTKKVVLLVVTIIILVGLFGFILIHYFFTPTIKLKEGKTYLINYKDKYQEPGYYASFHNEDLTNKVKVSGKVNPKKLGNYKVKYYINNGIFSKKVIRTVKVRDIEKPTIKLESTEDIIVCPGKKYEEETYQAIDNYDGNITNKVKVTKNEDSIRYAVVDSSGNYNIITRKIKYMDKENPTIELNENEYITIYLNEEYQEPGYKAYDNCDGEITQKVEVSSNIDYNTLGQYEIIYKVTDSNQNESQIKRTVNVVKKSQEGTIYLTFDDGPRMGVTNGVLDILKEEGVKATFFVTNGGPDELIKRAYDEGHSIGLHTSTHDYSYLYSSPENYFADLEVVHQRVLNITGYDSRIIRFPGGSSNTISRRYNQGIMSYLTQEVLNRNYKYYDWNISSGDAGQTTKSEEVYQNVVNRLSKDKVNVVLMHDIKPYTRDALKQIIEYGKNNGYVFDKIQKDTEMVTQKVNN